MRLHKKMQSHMCCICLTFLHCVFSDVSSKNLGQSRQSHIGCIYLTFRHCAFSNVVSNCLPEKRHSRIGYICSTFLHCGFSYVSSNDVHRKMHSHIGLDLTPSLTATMTIFGFWFELAKRASKPKLDCLFGLVVPAGSAKMAPQRGLDAFTTKAVSPDC